MGSTALRVTAGQAALLAEAAGLPAVGAPSNKASSQQARTPQSLGQQQTLGAVPQHLIGKGHNSLVYEGVWHAARVAIKYVLVEDTDSAQAAGGVRWPPALRAATRHLAPHPAAPGTT